jgi:hypothetical protein
MISRVIGVWLIFRGDELQPKLISERLNLNPSKQHVRGLPKQNSPNIISKTGLWKLESKNDSNNLGDHINEILDKLNGIDEDLRSISGVEDAYIDIFISDSDENENRVTTSFFLNAKQIKRIGELGLGIEFTS